MCAAIPNVVGTSHTSMTWLNMNRLTQRKSGAVQTVTIQRKMKGITNNIDVYTLAKSPIIV